MNCNHEYNETTIPLNSNNTTNLQKQHYCTNNTLDEHIDHPKYCCCSKSAGDVTGSISGVTAQCLITLSIILAITSCALPIGYSAILLPQLEMERLEQLEATTGTGTESTNSTLFNITDNMGSWIASIHSTATPIGAFLSGFVMDRFGRKRAVQISMMPLIVGWILIAFSQNIIMMLCGRFTAGLSIGFAAAPSQVIIGEMSEPHLRGIFSTTPIVGYALGVLLVYAMGSSFHWRTVAALSTILPTLTIISFMFLPDTPTWLIRNGRIAEGTKALYWLRKNNLKAHKELHQLMTKISDEQNENNNHEKVATGSTDGSKTISHIIKPHVLKPLIILIVFAFLQIFSGTYVLIFHAVVIVKQMGNFEMDSFSIAILTAVIRLICTTISIFLIAVIGRRPLALISSISGGVCAFLLGLFLIIRSNSESFNSFDVCITILLLIIYVAGNTVGIMPMFGTLISELSPAKARGLIGGFIFSINNIGLFVFIKFFPWVRTILTIPGIFILFGSSSLLGAIFIYLVLPETKNRSLIEIEDYFRNNKFLWIHRHKSFLWPDTKPNTIQSTRIDNRDFENISKGKRKRPTKKCS
ncbi:facilitated trehalose transporter Tret1-2 homolog [Chrysoperla carnea]|uniref:facilitated trehalose transporter Tret1-2 homolog n=1 Tax=Chrysoperla carnea TaxID=189513 RepID=UPI001D0882C8|nr:facilitated trehalose transporter Tret1-2 homolog [Chrysoperla carnea]